MNELDMRIVHKKFGTGKIVDFIPPKEYEDALMNNYVNIYNYVPKNDGIYVVQFDGEENTRKFHKSALGTFIFPDNVDLDTGEIIE